MEKALQFASEFPVLGSVTEASWSEEILVSMQKTEWAAVVLRMGCLPGLSQF